MVVCARNIFKSEEKDYNESKDRAKEGEVLSMLSFAVEYLIKEKKKSLHLLLTMAGSFLTLEMILAMYYDPLLTPLNYTGLAAFFDNLYRMIIIFLVLFAFVYMMIYSCQYYNKIHSKVLGLLKIFGYTTKEIVFFFLIQIVIILMMAFALFLIFNIPLTTLLFKIIYAALNENYVFSFCQKPFFETIGILFMLFIMIMMIEMMYVIQSPTVKLLKNDAMISFKVKRNVFIRKLLSLLLFGYGIYVLITETFNLMIFVTASLCALGLSGVLKYIIPDLIEWILKKKYVKAELLVVWKNVIFLLKSTSALIVFTLIINIIIQFYVYVFIDQIGAFIEYMIILFVVNVVIGYLTYLKLRVRSMNKNHYHNLYILGYSRKDIRKYCRLEITLFYLITWLMISIYPLLMLLAVYRLHVFNVLSLYVLLGYFLPLFTSYLFAYSREGGQS